MLRKLFAIERLLIYETALVNAGTVKLSVFWVISWILFTAA